MVDAENTPQPVFVRLPDGLLAPFIRSVIIGWSRDMLSYPDPTGTWMEHTPARSGQLTYCDHEQQSIFTATYVRAHLDKTTGIIECDYDGEPVKGIFISESRSFYGDM